MRPGAYVQLQAAGPFGQVFDVGGNVGGFAWACSRLWPDARVVSFEPVPHLAEQNEQNANGAWYVEQVAITREEATLELRYCVNQHSASSLHVAGPVRASLGIRDQHEMIEVGAMPLDRYLAVYPPRSDDERLLVKFDVEGHELPAIEGATETLVLADAVVVECNAPGVFDGAATPAEIDEALRACGLRFAGVLDVFQEQTGGQVFQFDGLWLRGA